MRMNELPATDPRRVAVDQLFDKLVEAVGKSYASYAEFRSAVEPLLAQATVPDDSVQGASAETKLVPAGSGSLSATAALRSASTSILATSAASTTSAPARRT